MSAFRSAVTFLTRIPIGDGTNPDVDGAPTWFPLVGALIGVACGGLFAGASWLLGPFPGAALAIAAGALITGAFHQDGLADTADAFGGGWTIEQRLEIFKDSRHGTYGVTTLVMVAALQIAALGALGQWAGFVAMVAAHTLGRSSALGLMLTMPSVRADGLGTRYSARLPKAQGVGGIFTGCAVVFALAGMPGLALMGACLVASAAIAGLSRAKIGGIVGDVLGAAEQTSETVVLLTATALFRHGSLRFDL